MTSRSDQNEVVRAMNAMALTQSQFSQLLGVSQPTISRWVAGESTPHALAMSIMARINSKEWSAKDQKRIGAMIDGGRFVDALRMALKERRP